MEVYRAALALLEAGEPLALATVIEARGSTPRHAGATMLIRAGTDPAIVGTIGGGRIEVEAIEAGVQVARGAPARLLERHLVRDLAMCCGGSMELYIEPVAPSRVALEEVVAAAAARQPCLLVTPLDGSPKRVQRVAPGTRGRPAVEGGVFIEPVLPPERLVLFGGGHVACAIGPLAQHVGFEVTVCDDGEVRELDAPPPWASRLIPSFELVDVERALGRLGLGDYAIILTRDHAIDLRILEAVLPRDELAFLGLIGSRGKVARFHQRLVAKGVATPERWARLRSPVGLDIGAETPDEIAVAVVAELVRERHRARVPE